MSRLGIDRDNGLVYEGRTEPTYPVWPTPVLSQATLVERERDYTKISNGFDGDPFSWIFREESFDPVSRIRRGRIFEKFGPMGWEEKHVEAHPALHSDRMALTPSGRTSKQLSVFIECHTLLNKENQGEGLTLAIGERKAFSLWRILQVERTVNLDVLVTLRAQVGMGALPDIDYTKLPSGSENNVHQAVTRVLEAAHRELPSSVIDQCRNLLVVLISHWAWKETGSTAAINQDLGDWIRTLSNKPPGGTVRQALIAALEIVNKLHPRGKDNEVSRLGLRPVTSSDAELAVQAAGFVLHEIGWTR